MNVTLFLWSYILITLFAMTAVALYGLAKKPNLIKKILMLNLLNDSINMFLIIVGYRLTHPVYPPIYEPHLTEEQFVATAVDPLPQALVLTAVVIGMAINILLVVLAIQIHRIYGTVDARDIAELRGVGE